MEPVDAERRPRAEAILDLPAPVQRAPAMRAHPAIMTLTTNPSTAFDESLQAPRIADAATTAAR